PAAGGATPTPGEALPPPGPGLDALPTKTSEGAPEVAGFGIRYFDGATWSLEWDSVARKGLPVAIEVAMQLRTIDETEPAHHPADAAPAEESKEKQPKLPTYRLVVHLPAAKPSPALAGGMTGGSISGGAKPPLGADSNGTR